MMAVTSAFIVLSRLVSLSAGASRSFACFERTKTTRIGCEFALVGPHFMSSWASRKVASLTGLSVKTLWVCASRRIRSSILASVIMVPMIELASVIRPGDGILWGQACAEPQTLVEALVAQRAQLSGSKVFLGSSYSGIVKPEHADHLRLSSY